MLVPKKVLSAANLCSNHRFESYALNGVHFRRGSDGKPLAWAGDGRMAVEVRWNEPDAGEFPDVGSDLGARIGWSATLPAKQVLEAQKGVPKDPVRPILGHLGLVEQEREKDSLGRRVEMVSTDLDAIRRLQVREVEGEYPDFGKVIPVFTSADSGTIKVGIGALREVLDVLEKIGDEKNNSGDVLVKITIPLREARPIALEVRESTGIRAIGVVMPMVFEEKERLRYTPAGSEEDSETIPEE